MKQVNFFSRGILSVIAAIIFSAIIIVGCKKQNISPEVLSKEETISKIAASK